MGFHQLVREILPALFSLYLIEGCWWLASRGGALVRRPGFGFRRRGARVVWAALTPLDESFGLEPTPPLVLETEAGLFVRESSEQVPSAPFRRELYRLLPWSETAIEALGPAVRFGANRLPCASGGAAVERASTWRRLSRLEAPIREVEITRRRQAAWNAEEALRRSQEVRRGSVAVRLIGVVLTLAVLVGLPVVAYGPGTGRWLGWALLAAFAGWMGQGLVIAWTARRLRRQKAIVAPGVVLSSFLSPPAAMLAAPALGRDVARGVETLALEAKLLEPEKLSRRLGRELWGSRWAAANADAEPSWREAWKHRVKALERLAEELNLDQASLGLELEADQIARCPLCDADYSRVVDECVECGSPLLLHD